ncbi:unnamed protein product [Camellia sinensis]
MEKERERELSLNQREKTTEREKKPAGRRTTERDERNELKAERLSEEESSLHSTRRGSRIKGIKLVAQERRLRM